MNKGVCDLRADLCRRVISRVHSAGWKRAPVDVLVVGECWWGHSCPCGPRDREKHTLVFLWSLLVRLTTASRASSLLSQPDTRCFLCVCGHHTGQAGELSCGEDWAEVVGCAGCGLRFLWSVPRPRFQRADLRRVQVPAPGHAGGAHQRHAAPRDPGDDQQVHDGPHPHPGEAVSTPLQHRGLHWLFKTWNPNFLF